MVNKSIRGNFPNDENVIHLNSMVDLKAIIVNDDIDTVVLDGYYVKGDNGSRVAHWDSGNVFNDNGGTIIKPTYIGFGGTGRWIFNGDEINVKAFGAKGDGVTNDTLIIQNALDYTNSQNNGSMNFDKGTFYGTYSTANINIKSSNNNASLLSNNNLPVLTLQRHTGTSGWDYKVVKDITIDGNLKTSYGIQFDPLDYLAGRWVMDNVYFTQCSRGVDKPLGNIGDSYRNCTWENCDFGIRALGSVTPMMHTGVMNLANCHMQLIDLAAIYIDDPVDGQGQWSFKDIVIENCPGFGIYMDLHNITSLIPPVIESVWLENLATAATVTIDNVVVTPRYMFFKDAPLIIIKTTYIKNIELVNSTVHAINCRIDDASGFENLIVDSNSVLIADNLSANGSIGPVPYVRSFMHQKRSGNLNLSVRGPFKKNQIVASSMSNATIIAANSYSGTGPWTFPGGAINATGTSVVDGILNPSCAEVTITAGNTNLSLETGIPTPNKWAVWSIHAKLVSGVLSTAQIGFNWVAGSIYFRRSEWVCSYGIQFTGVTTSDCRLQFINTSAADATIRLADWFIVEFDTEQEALEFVNSGMSLKNEI